MNKVTVYIVFRHAREYHYCGSEFIGVFFDRPSAEQFVAERPNNSRYYIEAYCSPEPGQLHQVFC